MGVNNRQRRAAKAKQRAANRARARGEESGSARWFTSPEFLVGAASITLRQLVERRLDGSESASDLEQFARHEVAHQQLAVDDQLTAFVRGLVASGWTPRDLAEISRRRVSEPLTAHLLAAVAAETARHDTARVAPEWLAQLAGVPAGATSRDWTRQQGLSWAQAREALIDLLCAIGPLPEIEAVIPPPGEWREMIDNGRGVDERILAKVRALLAKAESTEFEDEAEALTAKAQELMTTYAIEQALADANEPVRPQPVVRRLWLDAPYVDGKAMLVNQVAINNRCRCVLTKACGFVTLVGYASDLDAVELLSTSLLLQASRGMRAAGSQRTRYGTSRTRSFRQSFLVAYALRIGERLHVAAHDTESRADAEHGGALLPVLAKRDDVVADFAATLFPEMVTRSVSASNMAGWGAGRAAADLALFDIHDAIERTG